MIVYMSDSALSRGDAPIPDKRLGKPLFYRVVIGALLLTLPAWGQTPATDWQAQVRKYSQMKDWASALQIVDQEIARVPGDVDVRAWRARVLAWSGNLAEAEREYLQILQVSKSDPDNWLGLANVYLGEGKSLDALRALDIAVALDPGRADVRMARGRALAATGDRKSAQLEFQQALNLNPANEEARIAQRSVLGQPKNELRFGQEDNCLLYTSPSPRDLSTSRMPSSA